jgi:trk system potassium uptake protein TrkA
MGRFGSTVAKELYRIGHDVLIVDRDEQLVQSLMGQVTYAVTGDATSPELLEEVGIQHFDTAVVAIGTDVQSSVLATVLLKQQFQVPQVIARATSDLHGKTLQAVGADRVVYPEQETAVRAAHSLFQRDVLEYMELTAGYGFSKLSVTPDMIGKTLREAGLTLDNDSNGAAVVAIRRGRESILMPNGGEQIMTGDILVVAGQEDALERVRPG